VEDIVMIIRIIALAVAAFVAISAVPAQEPIAPPPGLPMPRPFVVPAPSPPPPVVFTSRKDMRRFIEHTIRAAFGRVIDDVDVDINERKRCVEIDVEIRNAAYFGAVQQLVCGLPELRGWQIKLEIDVDD